MSKKDPVENIKSKTHTGATGNLGLEKIGKRIKDEEKEVLSKKLSYKKKIELLVKI